MVKRQEIVNRFEMLKKSKRLLVIPSSLIYSFWRFLYT